MVKSKMKHIMVAAAITIASAAASADGGNGGNATGVGIGLGVGIGGSATATAANANIITLSTKGTVGDVSPVANGGSATIEKGAVKVSTQGTVGDVTGGTSKVVGSGNSSIAEGAVQNTVSTGKQANEQTNTQDVSVKVNTVDKNSLEVAKVNKEAAIEVAKINAGVEGTRDVTDAQQRELDRQAALEVARIQQTIKNTPSVSGPALTSSNDTCMGSSSGSLNLPGIGIGGGTTWTDNNCKMLKNSRELWNMGMKAAALALMCNDTANREALELTGFECPQTAKSRSVSTQKNVSDTAAYTDPFIRQRMGLAPLAE